MPTKEEVVAHHIRKKMKFPSGPTRKRYQLARTRLGLSANSAGSLDWKATNRLTTFRWKFETLAECARWMIEQTYAAMRKHPAHDRVTIALHFVERAFGIMPSDILGDQRAPPIVTARYIAMVCVRRSGIGRNGTARRFNRDQTVVKLAERKVAHLFEGIEYASNAPTPGDLGLAPDGQSSGPIST